MKDDGFDFFRVGGWTGDTDQAGLIRFGEERIETQRSKAIEEFS